MYVCMSVCMYVYIYIYIVNQRMKNVFYYILMIINTLRSYLRPSQRVLKNTNKITTNCWSAGVKTIWYYSLNRALWEMLTAVLCQVDEVSFAASRWMKLTGPDWVSTRTTYCTDQITWYFSIRLWLARPGHCLVQVGTASNVITVPKTYAL